MASSEDDPHGVCRGVIEGILAQASAKVARAIDRIEAALDDMYEVLDDLDDEE